MTSDDIRLLFGLYDYATEAKRQISSILKTLKPEIAKDVLVELLAVDWDSLYQEKTKEQAAQNEKLLNSAHICDLCGRNFPLRDLIHSRYNFYCNECLPVAEAPYHATCLACGKSFVRKRAGYGQMCADCLEANPNYARELRIVKSQVSRAKKAGLEASLSFQEWLDVLNGYSWKCAYCGGPYEAMEHIVPVYSGGGTTVKNCVPSCSACNSRKGIGAKTHPLTITLFRDSMNTWPAGDDL